MVDSPIEKKTVSVFPATFPSSPVIYLNTYSNEGQKVYEAAQAAGCPPFTLVAISGLDWNHDMVPWDSPAAFKKGESFTGGADDYLRLLVDEIIPEVESHLPDPPAWWVSPGTPWQGCLRCMPSIRRMCSPGWPLCPALCGFPVLRSTSSPVSQSVGRTASTSPWGAGRPKPAIRS